MTVGIDSETAYAPAIIERRWQQAWLAGSLFEAEPSTERPNWSVIELPPFANGSLHLGHVRNYVLADATARFRRMAGYNVLYTSGFDSFGLPSELAAREAGRHPADLTDDVMAEMREEFIALGLSHDPRRIIGYHRPEYYRWVQWVFLRLFERGLAYRARTPVHWCASCEQTLADSLVVDGSRCWRCGTTVDVRTLDQWLIRESAFAGELLEGLDRLSHWPDRVKQIHREWIGRRDGFELTLPFSGAAASLTLFLDDSRLLSGIAGVLVAPDHPVLDDLRRAGALSEGTQSRLQALPRRATGTGDATRAATCDDTIVLPLGVALRHPMGGADIPVAVCNGLDRRSDEGVAPLIPGHREADAVLCARAGLRPVDIARPAERSPLPGRPASRYRLRDWNIARQRYWGPPVPIVHCDACGAVAVPDTDLPVRLPEKVDLTVAGNPLARMTEFVETTCPRCRRPARRDTDTLEAYSSPWWYHWNCKHTQTEDPFDKAEARRYMPVDLMIGGIDQARTCFFHLRMMARALCQAGVVEDAEPVNGLVAIGMVTNRGVKMSKSAGNVVSPADVIRAYGVDALRLAMIEAAAPDHDVSWSDERARLASRFLQRVWALCLRHPPSPHASPAPALERPLDIATARVTRALVEHQFHLAARNLRMLVDRLEQHEHRQAAGSLNKAVMILIRLLAPLCPHIAEELWARLAGTGLVAEAAWPQADVPRCRVEE